MIKREIQCNSIVIESGEIGTRAVLRVTDKHGVTRSLATSRVVNIKTNCSGMLEIETAHTIYRAYNN